MNEKQESRYASRKFLLVLLVLVLGTALAVTGHLTPLLVDLMKWITGLYLGFNVSQKAAEWVANKVGTQ